jgi:hypothetical protein
MASAPDLLSALDMVVFVRQPDGSFAAIGRAPGWFQSLSTDLTFPFLGTFLETAASFWTEPGDGCLWSGPCEQVDQTGRTFHFEVAAVSAGADRYLVFERRPEFEAMQQVLQKARELTLGQERLTGRLDNLKSTQAGGLSSLAGMAQDLGVLAQALLTTQLSAAQRPLVERLRDGSAALAGGIETMLRVIGGADRRA